MLALLRQVKTVVGPRGRWTTLAAWIAAVAAAHLAWPVASEVKDDAARNLPSDRPSVVAEEVAAREFSGEHGIPALVVWHRSGGLTGRDLDQIRSISEHLENNPIPHQAGLVSLHRMPPAAVQRMVSADGTTLVQPVLFDENATAEQLKASLGELKKIAAERIASDPFAAKPDGGQLSARITGPAGISVDATELFKNADVSLLIATVLLVLVILLVIYRSPVMALVPLVGVGFAYALTDPLLGWLGQKGWIVFDSQALSIMTVLMFGAGTDYGLFLISKFRARLREEHDSDRALLQAFSATAGAIAMSGLTVVAALLALLLARYGAVHRFAIPFSVSILLTMIAALTVVPALLGVLGRKAFFPFIPKPGEKARSGLGLKIGETVVRRRKTVAMAATLLLGVMAVYAGQIRYSFDTLSTFPASMPSREGFTLIAEHVSPGRLAPVTVMIECGQNPEAADRVQSALKALPYVSEVSEPEHGRTNSSIVRFDVVFRLYPYSNEAIDALGELRKTVVAALESTAQGDDRPAADRVWIAGQTAQLEDLRNETKADTLRVIPVVITLIAVMLGVYLRSLVAMVYLMLSVLLSYFAALGLGWLILHDILGVSAIQGLIPLYAFVFIVALGEDYNIFMVSSIWRKRSVMPFDRAIAEGVADTGAVITSAGLILAATFAVLTTLPIQILVHFGVITAIGVLLDTFIVRPLLVPAVTAMLGRLAFWPGRTSIKMEQIPE